MMQSHVSDLSTREAGSIFSPTFYHHLLLLNVSGDKLTEQLRFIISAEHVCPDSPENNKH